VAKGGRGEAAERPGLFWIEKGRGVEREAATVGERVDRRRGKVPFDNELSGRHGRVEGARVERRAATRT
jgi:hypothetical protein